MYEVFGGPSPLLHIPQAIRCDQIFPIADNEDAVAVVCGGQLGEVGFAPREVDHADVKVAGQEGNHAVGEGVAGQEQAGAGFTAGRGLLVGDEQDRVGAVQEGSVFILFGQVLFADEA